MTVVWPVSVHLSRTYCEAVTSYVPPGSVSPESAGIPEMVKQPFTSSGEPQQPHNDVQPLNEGEANAVYERSVPRRAARDRT